MEIKKILNNSWFEEIIEIKSYLEMVNNISPTQMFLERWWVTNKPGVSPRLQVLENKHIDIWSESLLDADYIVTPAGFWHGEKGEKLEHLPLSQPFFRNRWENTVEDNRML